MDDYTKKLEETVDELQQRLAKLEAFNVWRDERHVHRLKFDYVISVGYKEKHRNKGEISVKDFTFTRSLFLAMYIKCKNNKGLPGLDYNVIDVSVHHIVYAEFLIEKLNTKSFNFATKSLGFFEESGFSK